MALRHHYREPGTLHAVADASIFARLFDSNTFYVTFCFISGACCFLPLLLGLKSNLEDRPLRASISSSPEFSYSCIASIALVIPLFIDVLFDILNSADQSPSAVKKRIMSSSRDARYNFLNIMERILILSGVAVLPMVVFIPAMTSNLALIYVCCCKCQQTWVGGTVALSLRRYNKEYFSNSYTFISLITLGFGLVTGAFVDNIYTIKPVSRFITVLDMVSFVATLIPCLMFICYSCRWFFLVHFGPSKWDDILFCYSKYRPRRQSSPVITLEHTIFPMVYTFCGTIVIALLIVLFAVCPRIEDYDHNSLLLNNLPFLAFVLLVSILSMRMVKFEVVKGLYALIESKKSYVRYISHELRTPLNSAFLGLKLLTDDLSSSENVIDIDRNDILADVNVACRTAVDILNDLLCLDKMESGIMEVHKHVVPVMPFIFDCVGMFSAQAREGCVSMSVVTDTAPSTDTSDRISNPSDSLLHLPLRESDIVYIDRFKMDQVVRNLISNALKFTPKGGSVTLTASFVPNPTADPVLLKGNSFTNSRPETMMTKMVDFAKKIPIPRSKKSSKIHLGPDYLEGDLNSTDEGEVAPTTISGKLFIVVKDTGAGMLEEDYSRLFKEIVQFNPEILQAGGGSGLGLWITKGIVDLHGGTVSAYSEGLGRGSSFVVELLMERKVSDSSDSTDPSPSGSKDIFSSNSPTTGSLKEVSQNWRDKCSSTSPVTNSPKLVRQQSIERSSPTTPPTDSLKEVSEKSEVLHLLIVDDSRINRKMLLRTLRAVGHICEEAEDGLEAIEKVKARMASPEKSYSAILIDFVMPNMDGPTATKEIRAMGYTAPIFGVTGNILTSDIDYFIACGVDRVLGKPLNMSIFRSCIDELIPCYSV